MLTTDARAVTGHGISFDTLADTSYRVSFTAGDGLSRLVVAKAGSAVSWRRRMARRTGENNNLGLAADLGTATDWCTRG
jgi:hypothetical protein